MSRPIHLIKCCVAVTSVLSIVSLFARMVVESSNVVSKGTYLFEKAMYWYDVAQAEHDVLLKIEHCATAVAFMNAAREVSTDAELEASAGLDVQRTSKRLERSLVAARETKRDGTEIRV